MDRIVVWAGIVVWVDQWLVADLVLVLLLVLM